MWRRGVAVPMRVAQNGGKPQPARVQERARRRVERAPDEGGDVDRVARRVLRALAEVAHELAAAPDGGHLRQRLEIEGANEVEQRLVLGAPPRALHLLVDHAPEEEGAGPIDAA